MRKRITESFSFGDRLLAAISYAFGIPSLYIILTEKRKEKFTGYHGVQALYLWILIVLLWILLRALQNVILYIIYIPFLDSMISLILLGLWIFTCLCGLRVLGGGYFSIPFVSKSML
jgi:uncharacterized membrane protein